jgi:hypothetical protein
MQCSFIRRKVGNGEKCLFWKDEWLGRGAMRARFGRLFDLCLDKDITVAELRRQGWGVEGNGWRWRRRLLAWEEEEWGMLCRVEQCGFTGVCGGFMGLGSGS